MTNGLYVKRSVTAPKPATAAAGATSANSFNASTNSGACSLGTSLATRETNSSTAPSQAASFSPTFKRLKTSTGPDKQQNQADRKQGNRACFKMCDKDSYPA